MVVPVWFSLDKHQGVFSANEFRYFSMQLEEVARFGGRSIDTFNPRREDLAVFPTVLATGYDGTQFCCKLDSLTDERFYNYSECMYRVMSDKKRPPAVSVSFSTLNPARLSFFLVADELRRDSLLECVYEYTSFDSDRSDYQLGLANSPTSLLRVH